MTSEEAKNFIAKRVAKEFKDGDKVNLGIGLPLLVGNYIPDNVKVLLQSENGLIGLGPQPSKEDLDLDLTNAGGMHVTLEEGGAYFSSHVSFTIIRGGHLDTTVLGALQVDEKGDLANWIIPGKLTPGMGGAMDLVSGTKKVIVAMIHTNKGVHKILKKCELPLTAVGKVNLIVTEMGVMQIKEDGLHLNEYNPKFTLEQIQKATGATLIINTPKIMTD